MSEMSEEALAAACAEKVRQLEFSVKQSAFYSVRKELETELAIARVALAALRERAEPVAYMIGGHYLMHANDPKVDNYSSAVPLYTAPPAPVVTAETFEEWSRRCEIQLTLCRPEFREVAEITWNACRAAMLAAPGKHPLSVDVLAGALRNAPLAPADNQGRQRAPVAAGWIACSERMPDDGVSVLAYCKCGDNFSGIYTMRAPVIRSKNSRKDDSVVHHERVTHWMPLPAAPGKEG